MHKVPRHGQWGGLRRSAAFVSLKAVRGRARQSYKASWSWVSIGGSFEGWHKRLAEQDCLRAAGDSSAGAGKGEGCWGVRALSAEQEEHPRCPPRVGNEVGSGVSHLQGTLLATGFSRRKPDVLRCARHGEKDSCRVQILRTGEDITYRYTQARTVLCNTQPVIAADSPTGKHLSLYSHGCVKQCPT